MSTRSVRAMQSVATLVMVMVLLAVMPAAPAGAGTSDAAPRPGGRTLLLVMVRHHDDAPRTAALTCGPPGGTHPAATDACAQLVEADGDVTAVPGHPYAGACDPDAREPVTGIVIGWWQGEPVWYHRSFRSYCELVTTTGFTFELPGNPG